METHGSALRSARAEPPVTAMDGDGRAPEGRAGRSRGGANPARLSPPWRKLLLTAHLVAAGGLLGADAVLIALGLAGLRDAAPATVYPAAHLVAAAVIRPLALLALATGLALGLLTPWGLVRHWWVAIKLAITVVLSGVVLFVLTPRLGALADAVTAAPGAQLPFAARLPLVAAVAVSGALLILNVALAVYKPFGRLRRPAG